MSEIALHSKHHGVRELDSKLAGNLLSWLFVISAFDLGGTLVSNAMYQAVQKVPHQLDDLITVVAGFYWLGGVLAGLACISLLTLRTSGTTLPWRRRVGFLSGGTLAASLVVGSILSRPSGTPLSWLLISVAVFCSFGIISSLVAVQLSKLSCQY